ncbi:PQQ-binding-like beta-propeller repeat protein [Candidatus Fermentibacteria bacterium]|nr:PQQ-binding-like beta-propeller repeat protein [Candidatus Fermentibacteria bacterium]
MNVANEVEEFRAGAAVHSKTRSERAGTEVAVVAGFIASALVVMWLLSRPEAPSGKGSSLPGPIRLAEVSSVLATIDTSRTDTLPGRWPQGRGRPRGNAMWGFDVITPFDTLWTIDTGFEFFSAPALVDEVLYLGCNDGRFRAVNASTGATIWSRPVTCGLCGEAAVCSTAVYFGGQDGYVYALDRRSGRQLWRSGLGYHVFSDVALLDTLVLAGNSQGSVAALNVANGYPVWSDSPGGVVLGPAFEDSVIVFTTESGRVRAYSPDGTILWSKSFSSQASPPSISEEKVFVGFSNGVVRCLGAGSGNILWQLDLVQSQARSVLSRPVVRDTLVLVGSCSNFIHCLHAESGSLLWEQSFENWVQVPPVVGPSIAYVSSDDQRLHLLDLRTGEKLDSLEMGGYSGTAPLLANGTLYLGNTSGQFFALVGTVPPPPPETEGEAADSTVTEESTIDP